MNHDHGAYLAEHRRPSPTVPALGRDWECPHARGAATLSRLTRVIGPEPSPRARCRPGALIEKDHESIRLLNQLATKLAQGYGRDHGCPVPLYWDTGIGSTPEFMRER